MKRPLVLRGHGACGFPSRSIVVVTAVWVACCSTLRPVSAVVIDTLTGTGNTSAPGDDPGWANVGLRGDGTGVYLGNGWVLTAAHVGGGSIVLNGGTYAMLAGSGTTLGNAGAASKTSNTDLYMFRLTTTPVGLGSVAIAAATTGTNTALTMIGAGRDRGDLTEWSVNVGTTPPTWTEVSSGGNAAGYKTLSTRTMRWGTNTVSGTGLWVNAGYGDTKSLYTDFTFSQFYSTESQATIGDSGGGVFRKNGSNWELTGLIVSVGGYSGQPDVRYNAIFGDVTYAADLSYYRPQIMAIVPEPSALALMACGGIVLLAVRRRRR